MDIVDIVGRLVLIMFIFMFTAVFFFIAIFNQEISEWLKTKIEYQHTVNEALDKVVQEGRQAFYDEIREAVRKDLAKMNLGVSEETEQHGE
ncbi:MAG: hypothetical protein IJ520_08420 [Synergistaceae bacterium]|nr:hypothetical protein [Synergistaceae bacterium]